MPKHRGLNLKTFVKAISWDLFVQYFGQLEVEQRPQSWAFINPGVMQEFLDDPGNREASAIILEDFRRINDLCGQAMSLVTWAYRRKGIPIPSDKPAQELAMYLYLNHRDAFDYAWSRYLLFHGSTSKLTFHHVEAHDLVIQPDHVESFKADLKNWFRSLAKGDECHVQHFEDQEQHVFLISRGSYLRTLAHWDGDRVAFKSFRPASEDVLVFDRAESELTIKASLAKDRDHYLEAFATHIAKDEALVDAATDAPMFTLLPFQDGSFDFSGNGEIIDIKLVRVRMKLNAADAPTFQLHSKDVYETLRTQFQGLSLNSGQLTSVELCFRIQPDGEKPVDVCVAIEPPDRTDLAQKRYNDIIKNYLSQQKVKLL